MECLNIHDLDKEINSFGSGIKPALTPKEKRRYQELQEFKWCIPFINFIEKDFDLKYSLICKNTRLECKGEDIFLKAEDDLLTDIHIQLTHANEYDMSPTKSIKKVNISGQCIIDAATCKCNHYCNRNLDTKEIILLIQGIDESTKISDLVNGQDFLKSFNDLKCFKGIYYVTPNQVKVLKKASF